MKSQLFSVNIRPIHLPAQDLIGVGDHNPSWKVDDTTPMCRFPRYVGYQGRQKFQLTTNTFS